LYELALNFASVHQDENYRGFSEVGKNKQLFTAFVVVRYFFIFAFILYFSGQFRIFYIQNLLFYSESIYSLIV
jgi:hypothetical protein